MQSPIGIKIGLEENHVFHAWGTLSVETVLYPQIYQHRRAIVRKIYAHVGTPSTGADIILDINKDGTTVSDTKTIISAGDNSGTNIVIDNGVLDAGSLLSLNVDQIGSGDTGEDLTVTVVVERIG